MKTSNKILLSLFALILATITIILVLLSKDMDFMKDNYRDDPSGKAEQQRNLPHFNKIEFDSRFHVRYTQDTFQSVVVKADSSLIDLALTEVNNGTLKLHTKQKLRKKQQIDVFVTTDSINEVQSSAGATFKTINKMKVYQFEGSGSAGAVFDVEGDFAVLKLEFSAGCVGNFSGNCKNLSIESSAGAVLNAHQLITEKGEVSASAGAIVNIKVLNELSVDASAGSIVKNEGKPQLKSVNISSGAQFLK